MNVIIIGRVEDYRCYGRDGGLFVMEGGMTVHYKGLVVDRASAIYENGLKVSDGLSLNTAA